MLERGFLIFSIFSISFGILFPGSSMNGIRDKFFFSLFLGLSLPLLDRNNAGINFFNFLNLIAIFRNFLARVEYERNSGLNFFFLFHSLSHPLLAKNKTGKRFFSFLNFFAIFFGIFLPGLSLNGIRN